MVDGKLTRRSAVVAGGAALAALSLVKTGLAAPVIQSGGGIAGGGSMTADGGPAEFSVFGSRFAVEGSDQPLLVGALTYLDVTANILFESTAISDYGPVAGSEATHRQMIGTVTKNGAGAYPFVLVLVDGGGIGSGADAFDLAVGADGDTDVTQAEYEIAGIVESGNLQLIDFDFEEADATPASG